MIGSVKSPVVITVFNRPGALERVLSAVVDARPKLVMVIGDGPRPGVRGEAALVTRARGLVERSLANLGNCELVRFYSEENLGHRKRLQSGLDRAFDIVDHAIVLEHDCVPHATFFPFCDELLERWAGDDRVTSICGTNPHPGLCRGDGSYFFSRYFLCWGWATWRRAWLKNDPSMDTWPEFRRDGRLRDVLNSPRARIYWRWLLESCYQERGGSWDRIWHYSQWASGALKVIPRSNLVSNIGFGGAATHCHRKVYYAGLPTSAMDFPLTHPAFLVPDTLADRAIEDRIFSKSFLRRLTWALSLGAHVVGRTMNRACVGIRGGQT